MCCVQFLESYKGININKDNTQKQFKVFCVIGVTTLIYAGSVEILKRKIDKELLKNDRRI